MQGLAFEPFFSGSAVERLNFLQNAAEYILEHSAKSSKKTPSMKTLFLGHVKRMRAAYNIVKNALKGNGTPMIDNKETKWAQCLMGIAGFIGKMTDTQHNVQSMNRHVEQMVKEAIGCSSVEIVLEKMEEKKIFMVLDLRRSWKRQLCPILVLNYWSNS